ncbi:hypothetical protein E4U25_004862 [Claviceps purpurea]|nr:hypothetical protein E4U25_004862 [Claviceps purpurea]
MEKYSNPFLFVLHNCHKIRQTTPRHNTQCSSTLSVPSFSQPSSAPLLNTSPRLAYVISSPRRAPRLIMLDTMLILQSCALPLPNRLSLWRPVVLSAPKTARVMQRGCSALLVWPPAPVLRMMAVQSILSERRRQG